MYKRGPVLFDEEEGYWYCRAWKDNRDHTPLFMVYGRTQLSCKHSMDLMLILYAAARPESFKMVNPNLGFDTA